MYKIIIAFNNCFTSSLTSVPYQLTWTRPTFLSGTLTSARVGWDALDVIYFIKTHFLSFFHIKLQSIV